MSKKSPLRVLKDADDIFRLLTGKRIRDIVPRAVDLFGLDLVRKLNADLVRSPAPDDPYSILEIRQDASELVVKAAFRAKVKTLHPDTGHSPDAQEFQRVNDAYKKIMDGKATP